MRSDIDTDPDILHLDDDDMDELRPAAELVCLFVYWFLRARRHLRSFCAHTEHFIYLSG